jgi:hypothetical protein
MDAIRIRDRDGGWPERRAKFSAKSEARQPDARNSHTGCRAACVGAPQSTQLVEELWQSEYLTETAALAGATC